MLNRCAYIKWLVVTVLFTTLNTSYAQLNNQSLSDEIKLVNTDSACVGFTLNNFNYLRNTEYFNAIEVGRTLFGSQLHPQVFYQPHPKIRLQGGVFLQADFGETPVINAVLPTLTLKINNKKNTGGFLFGTLEGALAHQLLEPLFDINSAITNRIEYGAQFKVSTEQLFFDGWINWENYIAAGYNQKEQFTAGLNLQPTLNLNEQGWQWQPIVQWTAFHRGGQIDTDSSNMLMVFNGAVGFGIQKQNKTGVLKKAGVSGFLALYKENSNSNLFYTQSGDGAYFNAYAYFNKLGIMVNYWQGNDFIAPRGTAIYQSVGAFNTSSIERNRKLLFMRLFYNHKIYEQVDLSARFEPVQDLVNNQLDFSFSLYLNYRLSYSHTIK